MSSSPFVLAILHQDALLHFFLPKFQMYDGLEDPFNHLMEFCQIMTLQSDNDTLLCKVFPSSLVGSTLSWFHRLSPNTVTSFRCLFEKFVTQYIFSVMRKQSVASLFHVHMGPFESIKDVIKCFGVAILQLEVVCPNIVLQAVKQAIRFNTQLFDSLSLHPLATTNKLFQRRNQYAMLKVDMVAATKQTVATTSESRHYGESKGKRGQEGQDRRGTHESRELRRISHHSVFRRTGKLADENSRRESDTEHTKFTLPPSL